MKYKKKHQIRHTILAIINGTIAWLFVRMEIDLCNYAGSLGFVWYKDLSIIAVVSLCTFVALLYASKCKRRIYLLIHGE